MRDINEFFNKYKINPQNVELYEMAFTHASCNSDQKTSHHDYERLEFMGDSVLGFVIASLLFKYHPDMREGELTKAKSYLVQTEFLAKLARQEHYEDFIRIGHSLEIEDVVENKSILEDVFESVIGAMYLDKGLKSVSYFDIAACTKPIEILDPMFVINKDIVDKVYDAYQSTFKMMTEQKLICHGQAIFTAMAKYGYKDLFELKPTRVYRDVMSLVCTK